MELGRGDPTWTRRLAAGPAAPAVIGAEPGRSHSFLLPTGFLWGLRWEPWGAASSIPAPKFSLQPEVGKDAQRVDPSGGGKS